MFKTVSKDEFLRRLHSLKIKVETEGYAPVILTVKDAEDGLILGRALIEDETRPTNGHYMLSLVGMGRTGR